MVVEAHGEAGGFLRDFGGEFFVEFGGGGQVGKEGRNDEGGVFLHHLRVEVAQERDELHDAFRGREFGARPVLGRVEQLGGVERELDAHRGGRELALEKAEAEALVLHVVAEIEEEREGPRRLRQGVELHFIFFLLRAVGAEALLERGFEMRAQMVRTGEVIEQQALKVEHDGVLIHCARVEEGLQALRPLAEVGVKNAEEREAVFGLGDDRLEEGVLLKLLRGKVAQVLNVGDGGGAGGITGEFHGRILSTNGHE